MQAGKCGPDTKNDRLQLSLDCRAGLGEEVVAERSLPESRSVRARTSLGRQPEHLRERPPAGGPGPGRLSQGALLAPTPSHLPRAFHSSSPWFSPVPFLWKIWTNAGKLSLARSFI